MISAVAGAAADLLASLVGGCSAAAASTACASAAAAALRKKKYVDAIAAAAKIPEADGGPAIKTALEAVVSGIGERRLRCAKPVEPDERVGATGALARHWQDPLLVCAAPQLQPRERRHSPATPAAGARIETRRGAANRAAADPWGRRQVGRPRGSEVPG